MQDYIESKKELQRELLEFLDCDEENWLQSFAYVKNILDDQNVTENQDELTALLHLITSISNNYHRTAHFFDKIEEIIQIFEQKIKQTYSNFEIFNIFKSNKRILLYLFKNNYLIMDEYIAKTLKREKYRNANYLSYFYPEVKNFLGEISRSKIEEKINEQIDNEIDKYETLREEGENHYEISKLIRDDSVEEFITLINRERISLTSKIKRSIFETNPFLIEKSNISLIEYASFYGSIQIVRYLYANEVEMSTNMWYYSIHSGNPTIIHFLEEEEQKFDNDSFSLCFNESVKCHQINISNYLFDNYSSNKPENEKSIFTYGLPYYNYVFSPENFNQNLIFDMLFRYDHTSIVKILFDTNDSNLKIDTKIIFNLKLNMIQNLIFFNHYSVKESKIILTNKFFLLM